MKEYYTLIRDNFLYAAKIYLIAFGAISAICVSVIIHFYFLDNTLVIVLGILAPVVLSAFLLLQTIITGNYQYQRKKKVFGVPVIMEFFRINNFALFKTVPESKMDFIEIIMRGRINHYLVEADIDEENPLIIIFKYKSEKRVLNKEEFNQIFFVLKENKAFFTPDGIFVKIEFFKIQSAQELQSQLESVANVLYAIGFGSQ